MEKNFPILVMEDNSDDAFLLQRALKRNGITNRTLVVRDGQEGIDYVAGIGKYGDRSEFPFPGCIIADLKMPRLGGFEFLAWKRERPELAAIPTLVLSSSTDDSDIAKAYLMGANSYLVKPTQFEDFEELVKIVHLYWSLCVSPKRAVAQQRPE